jgi:hypothetical protein
MANQPGNARPGSHGFMSERAVISTDAGEVARLALHPPQWARCWPTAAGPAFTWTPAARSSLLRTPRLATTPGTASTRNQTRESGTGLDVFADVPAVRAKGRNARRPGLGATADGCWPVVLAETILLAAAKAFHDLLIESGVARAQF